MTFDNVAPKLRKTEGQLQNQKNLHPSRIAKKGYARKVVESI